MGKDTAASLYFADMETLLVADLSDNALIAIAGDDAAEFLQGQFTNDVKALGAGRAQWNGWCSPKGRLLATFLLARSGPDYLLMLPAEIAPSFARRLGMFVLRSKVKITDASGSFARFGLGGPGAAAFVRRHWGSVPEAMASAHKDGAWCVALDGARFVAWVPLTDGRLLATLRDAASGAGRESWDREAIRAGVPTIVAATQEAFVPQMANFELVGGVSFQKGCYTGQEIVARTQYRGILKRRMATVHVPGPDRPMPGDSVYSASFGEQAAGTVVNSAPAPGGFDALVVAQIESLDRQDLRWKSPDGPPIEILKRPPLANAS